MSTASPRQLERWEEESHTWLETYADPREHHRRKAEMRRKLEHLGVTRAPAEASIYDLCCGMGEALVTLHELGLRNLNGIDFTAFPNVSRETRFRFVQADVRSLPLLDASADWLLNIHSLHHLRTPENVETWLAECYRVLKPGGQLGIVDFPGSPQIHLMFRLALIKPLRVTRYLRWFGSIIESEWHFLKGYLAAWPRTRRLLHEGPFQVARHRQELFYYYLSLRKPDRKEREHA